MDRRSSEWPRRSCDETFELQIGSNQVWILNVEFRSEDFKENQERSSDECGTAFAQRGILIWRLRLRWGPVDCLFLLIKRLKAVGLNTFRAVSQDFTA